MEVPSFCASGGRELPDFPYQQSLVLLVGAHALCSEAAKLVPGPASSGDDTPPLSYGSLSKKSPMLDWRGENSGDEGLKMAPGEGVEEVSKRERNWRKRRVDSGG